VTQPLEDRRILVTGGATGIGAAAVQVLTDAGARVVATYHQTPPPEREYVTWVQCDVRDAVAVDGMVDEAVRVLGGLDVLLHAAGLWQPGIPGQITAEEIDFLVDTNLKATIFTNQAAYRVMRDSGGGRIVNFGSGEAVMGSPISALYAATKGAVSAWTRSIAKAWAAEKISAIALAPAVQTPGADRLREFLGPAGAAFIDEEIKKTIPLGGALGDPVEDLGPALVFFCSEGSHFMTGQLVAVDGGLVMLGA
jgi:NAD(P)-dependent dehydrogenase (short-subunit alcohol dehydrogenase family)